ncbi:DUF2878 domain-containing protein [Bordetella sp. FB-8]|uniref:DUF2878 domain-containing protein n=1 Tax=Bordetella sp. FB-8 TaxID=1159870 RepID=UPI0003629A4B|nr:DUF2878 domain-containing protein [Bordetella sp. FB-8]
MKSLANFLGYEAVWFAAVIGAGRGDALPGCISAAVFLAWQIMASDQRAADLRLSGIALLCGLLIDGGLSSLGWLRYAASGLSVPPGAPLWILALWVAFAMTLNHSMAWLRGRPAWACALGLAGGPLAYWGASRGWQSVVFEAPVGRAVVWLAAGWGIALPLLASLAARWSAGDAAPRISHGGAQ